MEEKLNIFALSLGLAIGHSGFFRMCEDGEIEENRPGCNRYYSLHSDEEIDGGWNPALFFVLNPKTKEFKLIYAHPENPEKDYLIYEHSNIDAMSDDDTKDMIESFKKDIIQIYKEVIKLNDLYRQKRQCLKNLANIARNVLNWDD